MVKQMGSMLVVLAGLTFGVLAMSGCGAEPAKPAPAPIAAAKDAGTAAAQPATATKPSNPATPATPAAAPATPAAPVTPAKPGPAPTPPTAGGDNDAPAKPAAATDYVVFAEVRINQLEKGLIDLRAFLDHSVPMFAAAAMGEVYPVLVHGSKLDGIDGTKALRLVLFSPKQVFNAREEGAAEGELTPAFAQLVPIKDEKAYLDMVGEEVDEIIKDGDYRGFTPNAKMGEIIFKFSNGYAVFSKTKEGVELGIKQIPAIAAREGKTKDASSAVIEVRPMDLFKATGLSDPAQRKKALDQVEKAIAKQIEAMGEEMGPFKLSINVKPEQVRQMIEDAMGVADQAESVGMTLDVKKDACEIGFALQGAPATELNKRISGMKQAEAKNLRGIEGLTPFVGMTGSLDPMIREALEKFMTFLPEKDTKAMAKLIEALKSLENQPMSMFAGFNDKGKMGLAGEVNFKKGTDMAKIVDQIADAYGKALSQGKELHQLYAEMEMGAAEDRDGWSVRKVKLTYKADEDVPMGEMQLKNIGALVGNPVMAVVMTQGERMVYAVGEDTDKAFAAGKGFATGGTEAKLSESYRGYLKQAIEDRRATLIEWFDLCPIVKRSLEVLAPNPAVAKLADQTIGTANPLTFAIYAKDGRLEGSLRVEADTVKQWVAFGMQAAVQMNQPGNGPGGEVPAPPEPGQGQDF